MANFKKGDTVLVLSGADKGSKGTVARMYPKTGRALVEGMNMKKDHLKPRAQGKKGQVVEKAHPINISNLSLVK